MILEAVTAENSQVTLVGELVRATEEFASEVEEAREERRQKAAEEKRNEEEAVVLGGSLAQSETAALTQSQSGVNESNAPPAKAEKGSTVDITA